MKKILLLLLILPLWAHAANERAKRDINGLPALLGVSDTTGELRRVKVSEDGFVLIVTTKAAASTLVDQGAAGATEWIVRTTSDTSSVAVSQLGAWTVTVNQPVSVDDNSGSLTVDDGGASLTVDASSLPLPTGASTAANQVTGNTSLSSIDGKVPSQGQAASAASVPVVIASDQSAVPVSDGGGSLTVDGTVSTTLLPGATIQVENTGGGGTLAVDDAGGSLTVDGTVTANAGTGIFDTTGSSVSVQNVDGTTLGIDDAGGSITIDGTVLVDASGNDTPFHSTHSVSGTPIEVMASDASRESSLICNEGPDPARCAEAGVLTSSVGQRLLVDQCFTKDGPTKPYRGALSCVSTTGSPTKITADEST